MKVLITGGRSYSDRQRLFGELDQIHAARSISLIIHGAASGADTLADDWARAAGVEVVSCAADWKRHGRAAGPIRNAAMLKDHSPNMVVAFPGGRGTANMIALARAAGVVVVEI
jgi:hypothetical protein